ncbi:hypothetical protein NE865_15628 [Phthorimaea operculella]|nr:hypothetical protein NE865_15628 [Phthorimaea operculella]
MPSLEEVDTDGGSYDARRMASLLGIHLVSQVLEEACSIVNNEQKRGWFKDYQRGRLNLSGNINIYQYLQGDHENKENISHLTTSTPQKDDAIRSKPDNSFIGQGDEEINMVKKMKYIDIGKEDKSHSEEEIEQQEEVIILDNEVQMFSSNMMASLMNTLFEAAFATSEQQDDAGEVEEITEGGEYVLLRPRLETSEISITEIDDEDEKLKDHVDYCYSFADNGNNVAFYIEEDLEDNATSVPDIDKVEAEIVVVQAEIHDVAENLDASIETISDEEAEKEAKLESTRYEDAYLTLNRDYEQCSDDEGDPVLQDPKVPMQEVELLVASTEEEDTNSSYREAEEERKQLAATSAISGASSSRIKSRVSLVSRCRTQGARLLSCLRGWWRRKTPGKRKEARAPGSTRGICPLSPHARRRASSLLDQRKTYSPLQSRSVVWKFNTVNEALVNSSKWKDYAFDANADGCGEQC